MRSRRERRGGCRQGNCLGRGMTVGAKLWKVGRIKSGVGCVETVVSVLGGQKERVPTGLFGLTTDADGEQSVRTGWSLAGCGPPVQLRCIGQGNRRVPAGSNHVSLLVCLPRVSQFQHSPASLTTRTRKRPCSRATQEQMLQESLRGAARRTGAGGRATGLRVHPTSPVRKRSRLTPRDPSRCCRGHHPGRR